MEPDVYMGLEPLNEKVHPLPFGKLAINEGAEEKVLEAVSFVTIFKSELMVLSTNILKSETARAADIHTSESSNTGTKKPS